MIIDSIANASRYFFLNPSFKDAFDFIEHTNFEKEKEGKKKINDRLIAIISKEKGKSKELGLEKFECHNKNIDVQYSLEGVETFGWKPRESCLHPKGVFDVEKDVLFFNDAPDFYFQLKPGQFVIFFPHDVHAPMIGEGEIKKLVLKVPIEITVNINITLS